MADHFVITYTVICLVYPKLAELAIPQATCLAAELGAKSIYRSMENAFGCIQHNDVEHINMLVCVDRCYQKASSTLKINSIELDKLLSSM